MPMVMERGKVVLTDAQEVNADAKAYVVACSKCECKATAYDIVGHGSSKSDGCLSCGSKQDGRM